MDVLCQQVDIHWICNSIISHLVQEKFEDTKDVIRSHQSKKDR